MPDPLDPRASVSRPAGPGLRRAGIPPLLGSRTVTFVGASAPRVRELLAAADMMSEGELRDEGGTRTWFGSTNLLLPTTRDPERLAAILSHDLHARARLLRVAVREASLRAPRPLGRATCEVRFVATPDGLRVDVDVQAPLIEARERGSQAGA